MHNHTLPTEILTYVFGHLPPSSLARASCVCSAWKTVAFPPLYQTVYLCLAAHLEQFVERIRTEEEQSQLSIVTHLKGLVFDEEYEDERSDEMIKEADIASLNTIIPQLVNLRHFSWGLTFVPQDPETFGLFQTQCPKLDSVNIWLGSGIGFLSDKYKSLFGFKDLTSFSITTWGVGPSFDEDDDDDDDPLPLLLSRCPNISSIMLNFDGEFPYSPSIMAARLGDQRVFPRLRRFYAQGTQNPNWMQFFEDPDSNPFRQFISRHPGIEDLVLGYVEETLYARDIDPMEFAQLFPSLKYYEGPVFLCTPLVLSPLAEQIEKIVIVAQKELEYDDWVTTLYDKVNDMAPALPKLRKFGFWAEEMDFGILVNTLRTIVNAAVQLEEIEIYPEIEIANYEVMSLITQVHGLRSVTLNESILSVAAEHDGEQELDWDTFASNLRRKCPRLRTIYEPTDKYGKEKRQKVWELRDNV